MLVGSDWISFSLLAVMHPQARTKDKRRFFSEIFSMSCLYIRTPPPDVEHGHPYECSNFKQPRTVCDEIKALECMGMECFFALKEPVRAKILFLSVVNLLPYSCMEKGFPIITFGVFFVSFLSCAIFRCFHQSKRGVGEGDGAGFP